MLSLSITSSAIILAVLDHCVDGHGDQRIINVAELTNGKGDTTCCVYGNCSCSSLDQALVNLASNVLINITTDVTLSSLIKISSIENVTVIGHGTPTINCTNFGGMYFTFCHYLIVQAITWDGCGTEGIDDHSKPALKLSDSSNILVKNCSFQYSKAQVVLLSNVSGDVGISHCNFAHNSHYKGHGALIHYSSNKKANYHQQLPALAINDCNFIYNKYATSLVYIKSIISNKVNKTDVTFYHINFLYNQGIPLFIVNQKIYETGRNFLKNNTAGVIAEILKHSTIIFDNNSDTIFVQNSALQGVISLEIYSYVVFHHNSMTTFDGNKANYGGAIYSRFSSMISFEENCKVIFSNNIASHSGGAISSDSIIYFKGASFSVFKNNSAGYGGAIYSELSSMISFEENCKVIFSNNIASYSGGAISSDSIIYF